MTAVPASNRPDEEGELVNLSLTEIRALTHQVLDKYGLAPSHSNALTETIVAAERDECASHGVYRLAGLVQTMASGKVNLTASPQVRTDESSVVRVDADGGFSPLAFKLGAPELARKAHRHGVAAMAINRCVHFTALWSEVETLAAEGVVSIAMTPSHSWVAPAGGRMPLFGTNPFAFGWPHRDGNPYVFDFATSMVARGEVELHRQNGKPIPLGWAIDSEGNPTSDANAAMAGALLTFGGHKGSALSTMIELLAGPLIGDLTSAESTRFDGGAGAAPYHGELVIALSPDVFLGNAKEEYLGRAEALLDTIVAQGARLPSQRRFEARERTSREGVWLTRIQYDIIQSLL